MKAKVNWRRVFNATFLKKDFVKRPEKVQEWNFCKTDRAESGNYYWCVNVCLFSSNKFYLWKQPKNRTPSGKRSLQKHHNSSAVSGSKIDCERIWKNFRYWTLSWMFCFSNELLASNQESANQFFTSGRHKDSTVQFLFQPKFDSPRRTMKIGGTTWFFYTHLERCGKLLRRHCWIYYEFDDIVDFIETTGGLKNEICF